MNKDIMGKIFPEEMENIDQGNCPLCGKTINMEDFKNEISLREFEISKMCQFCQNDIFGD